MELWICVGPQELSYKVAFGSVQTSTGADSSVSHRHIHLKLRIVLCSSRYIILSMARAKIRNINNAQRRARVPKAHVRYGNSLGPMLAN